MMREILFRGKRKVNEEWVHGFLFVSRKGEYKIKWYDPEYGSAKTSEVYPETVGQLVSGISDKNGKKIFEGDVLEGAYFTAEDDGYGVVSFDDGAFEISGNGISGTFHENYYGKEFEVIGNIHDNPELIGGAKGGAE